MVCSELVEVQQFFKIHSETSICRRNWCSVAEIFRERMPSEKDMGCELGSSNPAF